MDRRSGAARAILGQAPSVPRLGDPMSRPRHRRPIRSLSALLALILVAWLARQVGVDATDAEPGAERIARAFAARESGFMVTVEGEVEKLLPDDRDGSRHQHFLVRLAEGPTLLVAHNIDLAERATLEAGDWLRLRGQYEWNDRGGVLHWTHHSPDGDHPSGWIEVGGRRIE